MNKALTFIFILTVLAISVVLSSCTAGGLSDFSDTTAETLDQANTPNDAFSEADYKNYTVGVNVDVAGNKEIFSAQLSGQARSVYVSFTPISYNAQTYEYQKGERVYYRFDAWQFEEKTDERVYFEGNKTLDVIAPQAMMSAVFKTFNCITRPENYGYVRDTLAPLTFTESSSQAHADHAGNNAVYMVVCTWNGNDVAEKMEYTVDYATRKVDLVKTVGDAVTYYTSNEQIPEEAVAYFLLLAADMDHGASELYASDPALHLGNSAVYKETTVNYADVKEGLHGVLFQASQTVKFSTVINNVTDFDTYIDGEAIYFPLGDTSYYMLTPNGSLYAVDGIRICTPYITPNMTHLSYIHAPIVRQAEGTYDYEAVKALLTGTAAK